MQATLQDTLTPDEPQIEIIETIDGVDIESGGKAKKRSSRAEIAPRQHSDRYIWGIYIVLLAISMVELYSASSTEVTAGSIYAPLIRHSIFLAVGLGIVLLFERIHYKYFRKWAWFAAIVSLVLLLLTTFTHVGMAVNGAQRAINVAGFTIQPPEICKLSVVLLLATVLAKNQMPGGVTTRGVVISAIIVVVFAGLLWSNGLTNTILLFSVSVAMFLIGGMQTRKLWSVIAVYSVVGGVFLIPKYMGDSQQQASETIQYSRSVEKGGSGRTDTHKGRFTRYIQGVSPDDPITDINRQEMLSRFAMADGGLINLPGKSRESARLPLAFSDYIYSIVVEDTGFVGGVALLIIYLLLVLRAGKIAWKCSRVFPALLIMGCAVLIVLQALVHIAIVTGLAPVSGQPLPFISKGGTSILVMSAAIGMMLSVSRFALKGNNKKELRAENKELPEDMQAINPTQL